MGYIPPNTTSILPSYYLWDSAAAFANYLKTGDYLGVTDFPMGPQDAADNGVTAAHVILHEVPKATLVVYPFASQFHFSLPALDDDTKNMIASQTGLSSDDVPLAMFAGLIHERLTATVDTYGGAFDEGVQMVKDAIANLEQGNYYGMYSQALSEANAVADASYAARDQNYYRITVQSRQFLPVTTGSGWDTALSTVKAAYQNGTSLADALTAVANAGVRPNYFQMVAGLHAANEEQVEQAVADAAFPGYMASLGFGDTNAARGAWLHAAGAAIPVTLGAGAVSPGVIAGLTGFGKPSAPGARGVARAGAAQASGSDGTGAAVAVAGLGLLAFFALRRKGRRR